jgi:uncharacterized DUF497 family protein
MEIEFDPAKDVLNIRKHNGLSLALAAGKCASSACGRQRTRRN